MANKYYVAGSNFERKLKKYFESKDYYVARTAGSHGPFDLIAIHKERNETLLVQCKIRPPLKAEYDKLRKAQLMFKNKTNFRFIMAYKVKGKFRFELLDEIFLEVIL